MGTVRYCRSQAGGLGVASSNLATPTIFFALQTAYFVSSPRPYDTCRSVGFCPDSVPSSSGASPLPRLTDSDTSAGAYSCTLSSVAVYVRSVTDVSACPGRSAITRRPMPLRCAVVAHE